MKSHLLRNVVGIEEGDSEFERAETESREEGGKDVNFGEEGKS